MSRESEGSRTRIWKDRQSEREAGKGGRKAHAGSLHPSRRAARVTARVA